MPRHKLGPRYSLIARTILDPADAPSPAPDPAPEPAKKDPIVLFKAVDPGSDPLEIVLEVLNFDPSRTNPLLGLTAVAIPAGSGLPSVAEEWLDSGHPKAGHAEDAPIPPGVVTLRIEGVPDGAHEIQVIESYDE